MTKLIEIIPNFSEGRNEDTINKLAEAVRSVSGVSLVNYSSDANHNRSVFTLIGEYDKIGEAAFKLAETAVNLIDMRKHKGEHLRMGAIDVLPFVPIRNVSMEEAVALSKRVAQTIWEQLGLPSFLYEYSASSEGRRNLANIRKGQFEGMPDKLLLPEWAPDFGERKIHERAGIVAIGAREPLIAFNVNLSTDNIDIASSIAKRIRESSGGFKFCKAIGIRLSDRGIVQVSMNMVNYEQTPLFAVFDAIKSEAEAYGVSVIGSEIIGAAPMRSLIACAEHYLGLESFDISSQVLENHF